MSALLSRDEVRLLTLTGPGGTGKTRLAAQAAGLISDAYPDGVYWVPLAPLRDPALVLSSAAQALGAESGLVEHVGGRRMLIFFDNFEQVMEAAAGVAELLNTCANLDLLVTSREPLHLTSEHEYPVPPLAQDEGVRFFFARARAVKPDFEANGVVAGICRRLDDLPLALELAAARVKALNPCSPRAPAAAERQRTLRATIEWSYELLSQDEQRLFRRMSVFAGGCTLEAAEEVADADLDTLQSLVDKSLIRHGDGRFWMLETIRESAADELLRDAGETADIRQRHAEWMLALVAEAEKGLEGAEEGVWVPRLEREQDNLRAALAFTEEAGNTGAQLELVGSAAYFWQKHGDWIEGYRWIRAALSRSGGERSLRRAKAIFGAAGAADRLGALTEVQGYVEEGLSISRELGEAKWTAGFIQNLAFLAADAGDTAEGERLLEEALGLARDAGEVRVTAVLLANLGDMALTRGDYAQAITRTEEAHALFRELGLEDKISWTLYNLAVCFLRSGREPEALSTARESLTLSHFEVTTRIWTLSLLAMLAAHRGEAVVGATLIGVVDAARESVRLVLVGVEAELYQETVEELSTTLGQPRYEAAFAEGTKMDLESAADYALQALWESPDVAGSGRS